MRVRVIIFCALISILSASGRCCAAKIRVPEDHATIQAGINAASQGDTVLVAAGIYQERIQLKDGVKLRSVGNDTPGTHGLKRAEATVIDGEGSEQKKAGVTMAHASVLDGFTVTNVGHYDDGQWNDHHATQGEHQDHAQIGQPGTSGISVHGVTCTIQNNIVHHNGGTGIEIRGVEGARCSPHVHHNVCYRNMGGGIGSMEKSTALIEENTCFQNFYAGIGHHNASPSVIDNLCFENIRAGIGVSEGACPIVRGNKCHNNRRAGIGIRTGANTQPVIEENDCYENEMAGIGCANDAAPIVRSNRCYKNRALIRE